MTESTGMYGRDFPEPPEVELDESAERDRLLSLVRTGEWLDAQHFPPLRWAVPGLIPQGFGLFTGAPKVGKSWAALDIGIAVASGGNAFGKIPTGRPRPVLYLALEDGDSRLQWRARRLLDDAPIPERLHTVTRVTPRDLLPMIRVWIAEHRSDRPLVLLDTLGKVMPPALPGEGAYQRDYRIGGHLKAITDDCAGSTLLVVHHVRKMSASDWMDSTSGTNGLNGSADFTVNLHRSRGSESGTFRVTGRDVPEGEYAAATSDGRWCLDGADLAEAARAAETVKATEALGEQSAEIVAFIGKRSEPVKAADVALALGMDAKRAGTYLARLAEAGRVCKIKRGVYTRVESVEVWKDSRPDSTRSTDSTHLVEGPLCDVCRLPMLDPEAGATTHPTCGA